MNPPEDFQEETEGSFLLKYLITPIELIANKKIPWSAKALFALIHLLDDPKKGCWASNEYLAASLGISSQTVSNHVQLLKTHQYILSSGRNEKRVLRIDSAYKKTYKPLIRKFIGINKENNIDILKDIKILDCNSDRVADNDDDSPKRKRKRHLLIDYWNELPNIRIHKSPETKTYRRAVRLINQLKAGIFTKRNKIDPDFLKRNKISDYLLTLAFGQTEIEMGMDRLSNLLTGGYWPEDKSKLPKDLPTLLYNPQTATSMFLMVMQNEPKLLFKRKRKLPPDPNPEMTEEFISWLSNNGDFHPDEITNRDRRKFTDGIEQIKQFHAVMPQDSFGIIERDYPYAWQLCHDYVLWLNRQDWIENPTINLIGTKNKAWRMFIEWQEKNLGVEMRQ